MKILVTGASGFVGRAVCRRLLAEGWDVCGAIRRDVPLPEGVSPRRVDALGPTTRWDEALDGIQGIVHLAARVHVMNERGAKTLALYRHANRDATEHLAIEARRLGVHHMLFMSSIKVNGEATFERPFTETDVPAPVDSYAISKWEAEQGLHRVAEAGGLKVTILRPPLVYGPGVGGNFRQMMKVVAKGWPLPLASIRNRRSLIYVENLADAVAMLMKEPAGRAETFLVADQEVISIAELIAKIAHLMGKRANLFPVPAGLLYAAANLAGMSAAASRLIGSFVVNAGAIHQRFGWTPPFTLDQGLADTVRAFMKGR
jgi:nucleoside-diphosphate-sugar epimerase